MTMITEEPISVVTDSGLELLIDIEYKSKYEQKYRRHHGIMYIFHSDEDIVDDLINRHSRPHLQYRKEILPKVREVLNISSDVKFNWNQKAGCKCPCSPGFLISDPDYKYTKYIISVYVKGFDKSHNQEEALKHFNKQVWGFDIPENNE